MEQKQIHSVLNPDSWGNWLVYHVLMRAESPPTHTHTLRRNLSRLHDPAFKI